MIIPGISEKSTLRINDVFKSFDLIEEVILYGSRAIGTYHESSDIDITLKGSSLTTPMLLEIERMIDDLLLPYKTDISIFHHISNPDLTDHINRKGVSIYKR